MGTKLHSRLEVCKKNQRLFISFIVTNHENLFLVSCCKKFPHTVGFIQWMDSVKQQLKKHDRFALQVASKDIQTVLEKDKGMSMKEFIRSISNTFTKSYKRTLGENQRGLSQLDQLDLVSKNMFIFHPRILFTSNLSNKIHRHQVASSITIF